MNRTTTINNVTVTEGELRAALKRIETVVISNIAHGGCFCKYKDIDRVYLIAGGDVNDAMRKRYPDIIKSTDVVLIFIEKAGYGGDCQNTHPSELILVDNPFKS